MRRPIPADFDGTIDEIAKNFVSGFTIDAAANRHAFTRSAGLRTGIDMTLRSRIFFD
jgi:hypothetical protein